MRDSGNRRDGTKSNTSKQSIWKCSCSLLMLPLVAAAVPTPNGPKTLSCFDLSPSGAGPPEGYTAGLGMRSQPVTCQDWVTSQSSPFERASPPQPLLMAAAAGPTPKPSAAMSPLVPAKGSYSSRGAPAATHGAETGLGGDSPYLVLAWSALEERR